MVTARSNPNVESDQNLHQAMDQLIDQAWQQEIANVATQQRWNTLDYHNLFILLPTINWQCGYHQFFNHQPGFAQYIYASYPSYKSQEQCSLVSQSPNKDHIADIATRIISHEVMEAVSSGWYTNDGSQEIGDKCQQIPTNTINPKTNGNVIWHGHPYLIQEEYDNLQHGCVLEGP